MSLKENFKFQLADKLVQKQEQGQIIRNNTIYKTTQGVPLCHKDLSYLFKAIFYSSETMYHCVLQTHVGQSCRNLCYITEYTIKLSQSKQTQSKHLASLTAYTSERDLWPLPRHQTHVWEKKDCVPPCIVFSHVPSSYCESQFDLSERVSGKWADHCQLLYPEGGWGSMHMSEDLSSYMKVAVNVAHYRLHLKKQSELSPWDVFFLFFLNYISDSNKTRKKHSTYHITWGASVVQRANNPGTKNKTIILGIANEYVLYGIVYSI